MRSSAWRIRGQAQNPLGVTGVGEAGCVGAPQAVVNAVLDALAPHGVTRVDMPLRPEKIWRALGSGRGPAADAPSDGALCRAPNWVMLRRSGRAPRSCPHIASLDLVDATWLANVHDDDHGGLVTAGDKAVAAATAQRAAVARLTGKPNDIKKEEAH